jgi:hypothetical protein
MPSVIGINSVFLYVEQESQCTYKRDIQARSLNICCRKQAKSITHSVCL